MTRTALVLLLLARAAFAGEAESHLASATSLIKELDFPSALDELAATEKAGPSRPEQVKLWLLRGVCNAYLGHTDEAKEAFRSALRIDRRAPLPVSVSSKVKALYEKTRKSWNPELPPPPPPKLAAPAPAPPPSPPVVLPAPASAPLSPTPPPVAKNSLIAFVGLETGPGVDQKTADLVGEGLVAAIEARTGRRLVSAKDIQQMIGLERQRELLGCHEDSSCLAELGGAVGADQMLSGTLGRLGESTVLNVQLFDTQHATVLKRVSTRLEGTSGDAFLDAADETVDRLFPATGAVGTPGVSGSTRRGRRGESHFEVLARVQVEPRSPVGGAMVVLVGYRPSKSVTLGAGAIAARSVAGAMVRAAWVPVFADAAFHPVAALESSVLLASPAAVGIGASAGLEYAPTPAFAVAVAVPFTYYLSAPSDARRVYVFIAASTAVRF